MCFVLELVPNQAEGSVSIEGFDTLEVFGDGSTNRRAAVTKHPAGEHDIEPRQETANIEGSGSHRDVLRAGKPIAKRADEIRVKTPVFVNLLHEPRDPPRAPLIQNAVRDHYDVVVGHRGNVAPPQHRHREVLGGLASVGVQQHPNGVSRDVGMRQLVAVQRRCTVIATEEVAPALQMAARRNLDRLVERSQQGRACDGAEARGSGCILKQLEGEPKEGGHAGGTRAARSS